MKRRLIRLYPKAWRDRYGAELEALIEDDPRATVVDVLKGALTVQFAHLSSRMLISGFAVTGLLIAVTAWAAMPNVYRSIGVAMVPQALSNELLNDAASKALSDPELRDLMARAGIANLDAEHMRRRISISKVSPNKFAPSSKAFTVAFDSPDPKKAQVVASGVMSRLAENLPQPFSIIDAPLVPQSPLEPNLTPMLIAGLIGGALGGLLCAGISGRLRLMKRGNQS